MAVIVNKFSEPWSDCPGCNQSYQNELAVELANEFVSFVEEKYPDDQRMHVGHSIESFDALGDIYSHIKRKR